MKAIFIVISLAIIGWATFILVPAIPRSLGLSPAPGGGDSEAYGFRKFLGTFADDLSGEPKATPIPLDPSSAEKQAQQAMDLEAAKLVKTYRSSLVFVSNQEGAGSGFLARYGNGNYLLTNAHVAAGIRSPLFKTLDGEIVQVGAASVAVGHDIFLMQAAANGQPFEIMKAVDQEAAVGDPVAVLGNSGGAGVIAPISGKILGFGPNLVEVDAPFVPGNSGSPIIHLKTGKVIGVATYLTIRKIDPATRQQLGTPQIRRFGYRVDSIKAWQPVNGVTFSAQAQEMEKIEALTGDLIKFLNVVSSTREISAVQNPNPVIRSRIEAYESHFHPRMSERDKINAARELVVSLKSACQADVISAQQHFTYDYFQRRLAEKQRDRTALAAIFEMAVEDFQVSAFH